MKNSLSFSVMSIVIAIFVWIGCSEIPSPVKPVMNEESQSKQLAKPTGSYQFLFKWGSGGTSDGQFNLPHAIAVDVRGNVYVVDTHNHRIQKFDSDGTFLTKWGSFGSGPHQFKFPYGVAVDVRGNVYVADTGAGPHANHRIQKFDSDGTFLTKWGSLGSADGKFDHPMGVAVDVRGNVYVADYLNHRIQKFDSDGNFLTKWGSNGSSDGEFTFPFHVTVHPKGDVYVSDAGNFRIQKFDSDGKFLTKWGGFGSDDGLFYQPCGISINPKGNVYVADRKMNNANQNHRIQKFDSEGTFLAKWGSLGTGDGEFDNAFDVTVDPKGNVYVADTYNNRIQKFGLVRKR